MTFKELERSNWIQKGAYTYNVGDQLKHYVYKHSEELFKKGDDNRDSIESLEDFKAYRSSMRGKFMEAIGGLPEYDGPLNAKITGTVRGNGFTVEKLIYESRPGTYVTSNLYLPEGVTSPRGAVVFVCGHYEFPKHEPEYQTVCQYLVQSGLVVLAQDPIGQGERFSYYEKSLGRTVQGSGSRDHNYAGFMCLPLGQSIARYFVHDTMRGIDYLCTRPEVDPSRIGITGNSGGGVQSSLAMICDPRIAAAAPGNFITSRHSYMYTDQGQDSEQIWNGVSAFGFDHEDVILMMIPKPVLVLASKYDFFPIEGTLSTVERVRRFWRFYGREDCLELFADDAPHKYTENMAKKAAEFFSLHLLGEKSIVGKEIVEPLDPTLLCCTQSGQVRGDFEDARAVYEDNCEFLKVLEQQRLGFSNEERKQRAIEWLRGKVLDNRKKFAHNPRYLLDTWVNELNCSGCYWWSQEGIFNHWFMFRDYRYKDGKLPVTVALWNEGTGDLCSHLDWIRETCNGGRVVVVLDVTGMGMVSSNEDCSNVADDEYGSIYKLAVDLIWIDNSLAAMRVYDVIRALDLLEQQPGVDCKDIRFYLHGRHGIYAQLASLIDGRIRNMEVTGGIGSYTRLVNSRYYDQYDVISIMIPGILKYFDLQDIKKWIEEKGS